MLGQPNNDKDFTHTQVGKIGLVIFDIEAFKISKAIYIFICIVWTA